MNMKNAKKSGSSSIKKEKRNKKTRSQPVDGLRTIGNSLLILPKQVNLIVPDRLFTRLAYRGVANFTIGTAGNGVAKRWQPSAAYDVDPALGSTATPGFAELAALYGQYRVTVSKFRVQFVNASSTPLLGIIIPLNEDPGSIPSTATMNTWAENPYSKHALIVAAGGPTTTLETQMSTEKIFGSKQVYFDDGFTASTNTIPTNNWYWAAAITSPTPVASATTITVLADIDMGVEFFSRKYLSS